jgi:hypothetical protein
MLLLQCLGNQGLGVLDEDCAVSRFKEPRKDSLSGRDVVGWRRVQW